MISYRYTVMLAQHNIYTTVVNDQSVYHDLKQRSCLQGQGDPVC